MKKCETKVPYKVHDQQESSAHYLCGRTVTHQVEHIGADGLHNVASVCGIHLKAFEKKIRELNDLGIKIQIAVSDAK